VTEDDRHLAPQAEFDGRVARVQRAMAAAGLDALVLTAQDNVAYLTGFDGPTWVNVARPRYCVLAKDGAPVLVVPTTNVPVVRRMTWVQEVRSWVSPNPADDGLSLVAEAVWAVAEPAATVGMEIGPQSRLGMPAGDFLAFRERLAPRRIADADALLREIRKIKTPLEIAAIRQAAAATSRAFARLDAGGDEQAVAGRFRALLFEEGLEDVPYLVAESGLGGYPSLQMAAGGRRLTAGSVLAIDTGARVRGYYCDFNRNFVCGPLPEATRQAHALLWEATEAGIRAAVPGATAAEVWRAMAAVLDAGAAALGARRTQSGRMGHGIGLRLTEPPSIHPEDATVLAPGMVITVEPSLAFEVAAEGGPLTRTLVHEENLVVTEGGPELLSARAPREMTRLE